MNNIVPLFSKYNCHKAIENMGSWYKIIQNTYSLKMGSENMNQSIRNRRFGALILLSLISLLLFFRYSSAQEQLLSYLPLIYRGYTNMAFIPAGEFTMGCDPNNSEEYCRPNLLPWIVDEFPMHKVYLGSYYIDIYEVTNHEYSKCVEAGICLPPINSSSYNRSSYYENQAYSNYPVIYVYWDYANTYCNWVGKRLPTEAEWEKAARGIEYRVFPWGNGDPDCNLANFWRYDHMCVGDTTEVGSYPLGASIYGVMDLAGNVREWVSDWYQADYYNISPYLNPIGPESGTYRVLRGGGFDSSNFAVRTAWRDYCT
jgi:formylglycine-generating enzyme required for sulfatase activity